MSDYKSFDSISAKEVKKNRIRKRTVSTPDYSFELRTYHQDGTLEKIAEYSIDTLLITFNPDGQLNSRILYNGNDTLEFELINYNMNKLPVSMIYTKTFEKLTYLADTFVYPSKDSKPQCFSGYDFTRNVYMSNEKDTFLRIEKRCNASYIYDIDSQIITKKGLVFQSINIFQEAENNSIVIYPDYRYRRSFPDPFTEKIVTDEHFRQILYYNKKGKLIRQECRYKSEGLPNHPDRNTIEYFYNSKGLLLEVIEHIQMNESYAHHYTRKYNLFYNEKDLLIRTQIRENDWKEGTYLTYIYSYEYY